MLVGAEEFFPDVPGTESPTREKTSPARISQAYTALDVTFGYLSLAASQWFGKSIPLHFALVADQPVTRRFLCGSVSVAVILFPSFPSGSSEAGQNPAAAVLKAAKTVSDADLVIGVSPWGFRTEYAAYAALAERFHVLLGAGEGAPFAAEVLPQCPSLLWSRADHDGRSLMVLDIMALPHAGEKTAWVPGLSFMAREVVLTAAVPEQPDMQRLLGNP